MHALDTDIVVAYLLYTVDQQTGRDVWQQLPVPFFFKDNKELLYDFDRTSSDVQLYLDGNTDFSTLGPDFTQNQVFRVVILLVNYVQSSHINLNNIHELFRAVGKNGFMWLRATTEK